jgi:hypothetical protein
MLTAPRFWTCCQTMQFWKLAVRFCSSENADGSEVLEMLSGFAAQQPHPTPERHVCSSFCTHGLSIPTGCGISGCTTQTASCFRDTQLALSFVPRVETGSRMKAVMQWSDYHVRDSAVCVGMAQRRGGRCVWAWHSRGSEVAKVLNMWQVGVARGIVGD